MRDIKNFLRLVSVEISKLFNFKNIISLFLIILVSNALVLWIFNTDSTDNEEDIKIEEKMNSASTWKDKAKVQIEANKTLEDVIGKDKVKMNNDILKYRIDNDIAPVKGHSSYEYLNYTSNYINIAVLIFIIYLSSKLYGLEIENKMEDYIYSQKFSRFYSFNTKIIALLISVVAIIAVSSLITFIAGGLFYGFEGGFKKTVFYFSHNVYEHTYLVHSLINIALWLITAIFLSIITFALTEISKNSLISRIISILYFLLGFSLSNKLIDLKVDSKIISYTFLPYANISNFLNTPINDYFTFTKGIIIIFILGILMYIISSTHLNKRDI
ncbi:hypothetical protein [Anaerococcus hydrogenalis]|uniref:hypothetical protein n=1 Tax=Anaerococcus hydrogenalis TaxID=33029 RepID=UPI002901F259|nr:hypothetical protein [Anaerococcus hydrogenalis]MDU1317022.1 hypothetical protein [Anaerococcus hydrogenalis]